MGSILCEVFGSISKCRYNSSTVRLAGGSGESVGRNVLSAEVAYDTWIGDIRFLSNKHELPNRTAHKDHAQPSPRRHHDAFVLATPENEGGWKLPFHNSVEKKRGGIQVSDQAPVAPLNAEWV